MLEFPDRIKKDWVIVRETPWPFVEAVIIAGVLIFTVLSFVYKAEFSAKDATIETLKSQIDGLKESNSELEKRLAAVPGGAVDKAEKEHRSAVIKRLSEFIEQGNSLLWRFEVLGDNTITKTPYDDWQQKVKSFLSSELGPAYLTPYQLAGPAPRQLAGPSENFLGETPQVYYELQGKMDQLNSYLVELRR